MVTSVPPMYGPVLLSAAQFSTIPSGFNPPTNSEFTQSKHPGLLLSNRNFRNVPLPLVNTRGQPLYCRPSLLTVNCATEGVRRCGVTHRASESET